MSRPKKTAGEAYIPFGVTLKPESMQRLVKMMAADEEDNRSRWLSDLVNEEWERRQRRGRRK